MTLYELKSRKKEIKKQIDRIEKRQSDIIDEIYRDERKAEHNYAYSLGFKEGDIVKVKRVESNYWRKARIARVSRSIDIYGYNDAIRYSEGSYSNYSEKYKVSFTLRNVNDTDYVEYAYDKRLGYSGHIDIKKSR